MSDDPRIAALPDIHGHAKGEHKPFAEERPIPYTARMLFLWFYHACRRGSPRFLMVADHTNYLTFEDPAAVNLVRRALKLAQAGDLYGAAETAGVEIGHAQVVSEGLRRGMRYSIGAEVDNDPRSRPDAQNIVDAMKPDGTVRSVHFIAITHPTHGENWMWAFDNPEFKELYDVVGPANVWELYMATLIDAIEKLPGNIVGHFYVPAKFGHWPDDATLEAYEDRLIAACAERGMAIEVNSRYLYKYFVDDETNREKFRTAHLRLLRKAKERNVAVAVGSDAHSPKDQGGAFEEVLALLDEAEINEIAFPIGGRLARVALRATEETLRAHAAALAPPATEQSAPADQRDPGGASGGDAAPAIESAPPPAAVKAKPRPKKKPVAVAAAPAVSAAVPEHVAATAMPKRAAVPKAEPATKPVAATKAAHAPKAAPAKVVAKPAPAKKAGAKKAAATRPVIKKTAAKKPAAKKAVAKKALKKTRATVAKKNGAKRIAPKRTVTKKGPVRKPVASPAGAKIGSTLKKGVLKKATAKKALAKKAAARKTVARKPAPKRATRPATAKNVAKKSAKRSRR